MQDELTSQSGQALTETLLSVFLLALLLGGSASLYLSSWRLGGCAYLAFEKARAQLNDSSSEGRAFSRTLSFHPSFKFLPLRCNAVELTPSLRALEDYP